MSVLWASMLLVIGLAIVVKGADWLVDGAVAIARHLGVNTLVIGLTIVAMGTSAPELATSVAAVLAGSADIAIGNVYGSNIANLALIGGICAMIRPIGVSRPVRVRDLPIMLGTTLLLYLFFGDLALTRAEAALILLLFAGLLLVLIVSEKRQGLQDSEVMGETKETISRAETYVLRPYKSVFLIMVGLACLAGGAHLSVKNAVVLGKAAGISEAVIGLTIIAVGTSLPELITCLVASFKGHDDLSIGNLVGSNIFNIMFVLGVSGLVRPFEISARLTGLDYWLVVMVSALFAAFAYISLRISRLAGVLLFSCYAGYLVYLFAGTE